MTSSPYAGLSAGRRRRISADDAHGTGSEPPTAVGPQQTPVDRPVPSAPLSESDTRSLVRGAVGQTLSAIATGHPRHDAPQPPP